MFHSGVTYLCHIHDNTHKNLTICTLISLLPCVLRSQSLANYLVEFEIFTTCCTNEKLLVYLCVTGQFISFNIPHSSEFTFDFFLWFSSVFSLCLWSFFFAVFFGITVDYFSLCLFLFLSNYTEHSIRMEKHIQYNWNKIKNSLSTKQNADWANHILKKKKREERYVHKLCVQSNCIYATPIHEKKENNRLYSLAHTQTPTPNECETKIRCEKIYQKNTHNWILSMKTTLK